jgi:copper homeostasis protein CutC
MNPYPKDTFHYAFYEFKKAKEVLDDIIYQKLERLLSKALLQIVKFIEWIAKK